MNITKISKSKSDTNNETKSFFILNMNYQPQTLINLLKKNPSLVNKKDKKNETLLTYAIKRKNEEICSIILASPIIDLSYKDTKGNSYLHISIINQLLNITKLLIKKRINLNLQNNDGNTALHFAYNAGNVKLIAVLIENNADLDIKNKEGLVPEKIEINSLKDLYDNNTIDNENDFIENKSFCYKSYDDDNNKKEKENYIYNQINSENYTNSKVTENDKNSFKYSLVNFSYSEDSIKENHQDINKDNDIQNINEGNKTISDIFNLTSSLTYKEKMKNVSNINSHKIGDFQILEKDNDIINLQISNGKNMENISMRYALNSKENEKKNLSKNFNSFNKSKSDKFFEYSTSISKEEKDFRKNKENIISNKNNNECINDEENIIYNDKGMDQDFIFSPFVTIGEPHNQYMDIINEQNNYKRNTDNFYIKSKNKYIKKNDISNNNNYSSKTLNEESNIYKKAKCNIIFKMNYSQDSLYIFLSEIKLEKYYNLLYSNGFEDIQLLINQEKKSNAISDFELKEAGIVPPGDRAKILIHLEERAGKFSFQIPKSVYYISEKLDNIMEDENIKKIYNWLKSIKVENYLDNWIGGGYYSIELMLMQMKSCNPINDSIMKEELGINKIGHRALIINKLVEDGNMFYNKLKSATLVVGNNETNKNCDCIIF